MMSFIFSALSSVILETFEPSDQLETIFKSTNFVVSLYFVSSVCLLIKMALQLEFPATVSFTHGVRTTFSCHAFDMSTLRTAYTSKR